MNCCWIPPLVERDSSRPWSEYDALVYSVFRHDFIEGRPVYHGKPVKIRYQPMLEGRAEAFWHLTCRDYDHKSGLPEDRVPDLERCRRIRWPKAFIENAERCPKSPDCGGVIAWKAEHRARKSRNGTQIRERIKFYLEEESYIVVFEPREHYCLLITAYYVDNDHSRKMIEREMARNHAEKQEALFGRLQRTPSHTRWMSYPDYRPIAAKCKPNTLWRLGAGKGETPCVYI